MKYYIIAGERSGDLHGANLIREIRKQDANAVIRCWGGDMMQVAGGELVVHYKETAFMGFLEVLKNVRTIKGFLKKCKRDILEWNPDVVVLIDYPGFNLRIAKFAKLNAFKTCYYISPKIWAWNQKRALKIKKYIDKMYCILPFEQEFYKQFDYEVEYVGNPLIDSIKQYDFDTEFIEKHSQGQKISIGVLPGSRYQEVSNMLDVIASIFPEFPDIIFHVAAVDNLPEDLYNEYLKNKNVRVHYNKAYDILKFVNGAVVTSGTATLETALFNVPQIVCYKTSSITYTIAKLLIKIKYISLVNLIVDKQVVKELIQNDFNPIELAGFVREVQANAKSIGIMLENYASLKDEVGEHDTSAITAKSICQFTQGN